ncbi:DUF3800 domain-containing protein [Thermodesulfobacteriota bacterium]
MPLIPIGSRHVFIDESGDPNLATGSSGVSDYFVLSAVIVDTGKVPEGEASVRKIVDRFFPKGELKSSRIGSNTRRRLQILEAIADLDFKHYSHVIDKTKIFVDSPLRFRRTFVKFINRAMYSRLFESFSDLHVVADKHGTSDFMLGFAEYLKNRIPRRLFATSSFKFVDSRSNPFIQVADIIAGSILRAYSGRDQIEILRPLRRQTILIDEWPPRVPIPPAIEELPEQEWLDYTVRLNAVRHAGSFIDENSGSRDLELAAQVSAVQYLLYHFRSIDPEDYIPTALMHEHLGQLGFDLSLRAVRERVIGRLRDQGVIIASARSGIKLPFSVEDLHAYAEMVGSIVVPYLRRLEKARKHYLLATEGSLDIVSRERQPDLNKFLEGA